MSARQLAVAALLVLLVVGVLIRLDGITTPPFDNAVARQFRSAVLARMYYVGDASDRPAQEQAVVEAWRHEEKPIEPPVMELLAAGAYEVAGHEALWMPRALSVLWWVCGAIFLFLIATQLVRPAGALAVVAVFLFLPFGVLASRSFQPDPLLTAAILAAVLTFMRYEQRPSKSRLALAALASAFAFFVKPGIALPLLFVLAAVLGLRRTSVLAALRSRAFAALIVATLPMFAWYVYGTVVRSFLSGHFTAKVSPSLLVRGSYWRGWWDQVVFVLTYPVKSAALTLLILVGCAAGLAAAPRGRTRAVLAALWGGYLLYGLIFTIHISTHNYYSLVLIPIVALSLGSLADRVVVRLPGSESRAVVLLALVAAVAAGSVSRKLHPALTDAAFHAEAQRYAAVGRAADHTARALYVDTHYAEPARYYGWTAGTLLTSGYERHPQRLAERGLAAALAGTPMPTCLIFVGGPLIERLRSFERTVAARFSVRRRAPDYVVFDLDGC